MDKQLIKIGKLYELGYHPNGPTLFHRKGYIIVTTFPPIGLVVGGPHDPKLFHSDNTDWDEEPLNWHAYFDVVYLNGVYLIDNCYIKKQIGK